LPEKPKCPNCGSPAIGMLKIEEDRAISLLDKKGEKLSKLEEKMQTVAKRTSGLIEQYGKPAAVALSARRVTSSDVSGVLEKESTCSDKFYELVLDAERKVLSKRFS